MNIERLMSWNTIVSNAVVDGDWVTVFNGLEIMTHYALEECKDEKLKKRHTPIRKDFIIALIRKEMENHENILSGSISTPEEIIHKACLSELKAFAKIVIKSDPI